MYHISPANYKTLTSYNILEPVSETMLPWSFPTLYIFKYPYHSQKQIQCPTVVFVQNSKGCEVDVDMDPYLGYLHLGFHKFQMGFGSPNLVQTEMRSFIGN